jgi:hypothetical protein
VQEPLFSELKSNADGVSGIRIAAAGAKVTLLREVTKELCSWPL